MTGQTISHYRVLGLTEFDPQQARIVEMRYFGGLTVEETAEALGISPRTVKREWAMARAWLQAELAAAMTPERWGRIKEVFHAALDRTESERQAFLEPSKTPNREPGMSLKVTERPPRLCAKGMVEAVSVDGVNRPNTVTMEPGEINFWQPAASHTPVAVQCRCQDSALPSSQRDKAAPGAFRRAVGGFPR